MQYGGYRGGSPAKQRRKAEHKARAIAEDAGNNDTDNWQIRCWSIAEEANLGAIKDDGEILEYELTKAAHKKYKN